MDSFRMASPVTTCQTLPDQQIPWVMTIPTSLPWSLSYFNDAQMTFTAKPEPIPVPSPAVAPQMKRKGSHLDRAPLPSKLYISEEKMIARMKELNIGAQTLEVQPSTSQQPQYQPPNFDDVDSGFIDMDDLAATGEGKDRILVLSDELKSTIANSEPIIPTSILKQIQKPSMELVLWKPPGGIISDLIKARTEMNKNRQRVAIDVENNNRPQTILKAKKSSFIKEEVGCPSETNAQTATSTFAFGQMDILNSQKDLEGMDL